MNRTKQIAGIDANLRSIERRGALRAVTLSSRVKAITLRAYRHRTPLPDLESIIIERLASTLIDAQTVAYAAGQSDSRSLAPHRPEQPTIQLGVFDDVLRGLSKLFDLDAIREAFSTDVYQILGEAARSIENEMRQTMNNLIQTGAHVREGVRTLGEKFESLGLGGQQPYRLEAIFRTQTQLAYGSGRWQADQDPAIQEILWGYEYNTVGDDRVRPAHAAMDGIRLPKGDPFWKEWWPPNGWNCRCVAIPIFQGEELAKVNPPPIESDGVFLRPDNGFAFNPGNVFNVTA